MGVTTVNGCGAGGTATIYLQNRPAYFYVMTSPNPATSIVSVQIDKSLAPELLQSVKLTHATKLTTNASFDPTTTEGKAVMSSSKHIVFDVSHLERGKYFLTLSFAGNKNFSEQLILQ